MGLKCRPAGAPAGSWPHTPWWHCVYYDPYERICVWSHLIPGIIFMIVGLTTTKYMEVTVFGICAGVCQVLSAVAHIYPDSHALEKLDHVGIVALLIGTPYSALLLQLQFDPSGYNLNYLNYMIVPMLIAAMLNRKARTIGFGMGTLVIFFAYLVPLADLYIWLELVMYALAGVAFIRNQGHGRGQGLSDHHMLHYLVTVACIIHLLYLFRNLPVSLEY